MKRSLAFALVVSLVGAGAVALAKSKPAAAPKPKTVETKIESKSGSKLTGDVKFSEKGKEVTVVVTVENAPPGDHAVHIHEKGDCSAPDAKSAGGHWNPGADQHGQWGHEHFHLGDIGNLKVGADGKGSITLTTDKWTLGGDEKTNVEGRAIIVHEKIDDFTTQPTGNAGNRLGCAVIPAAEAAAKPAEKK
jgi:Cu-Zn family superoxide dismutase